MSMLIFQNCFDFLDVWQKNRPELLQNGFGFDGFGRKDLQTAAKTV